MNLRPHTSIAPAIVQEPIGPVGPITIVDVGASGGIADYWSAFGNALHAIGFDPLVSNMRKLAAADRRANVRYEAAFVGCRDFDALFPVSQRQLRVDPYLRTSAVRAQQLMQVDFVADNQNEGEPLVWSEVHLTLDDYFQAPGELDFLKVDTDGSDFQVLLGADRLLREGAFLGVLIEAQLQGWAHDYANTFANIDRFLRAHGFALYDLDQHRYTRAALPGRFEKPLAAETIGGQLLWGDALYFRDLAHPAYPQAWAYQVTRQRLLKLVAFFDLFALPDCAAELLLAHPALTGDDERRRLLDMLAVSAGFPAGYDAHLQSFERAPASFLPSPEAPRPVPALSVVPPRTLRSQLGRVARRLGLR